MSEWQRRRLPRVYTKPLVPPQHTPTASCSPSLPCWVLIDRVLSLPDSEHECGWGRYGKWAGKNLPSGLPSQDLVPRVSRQAPCDPGYPLVGFLMARTVLVCTCLKPKQPSVLWKNTSLLLLPEWREGSNGCFVSIFLDQLREKPTIYNDV